MASQNRSKKIVIATPLYPPAIGGPSQYAKNLEQVWGGEGHQVVVVDFGKVLKWPSGIRHLIYFCKLCRAFWRADFVLILDTFSVALPAVLAGKLFGQKTVIRTGGDFLWESYVERTSDLVLFKNFYHTCRDKFNVKERLIYNVTKFTLHHTNLIVFSTDWQKNIFIKAYGLADKNISLIENYFGAKETGGVSSGKIFLASTRPLKWKNHDRLNQAFALVKEKHPEVILDDVRVSYDQFIEKMKQSYAVVLVSLGDISPNLILDAVRLKKPFIITIENGLESRLAKIGLRVDPENIEDIRAKISSLLDEGIYNSIKEGIDKFNFTHSWTEIAEEFLALSEKI